LAADELVESGPNLGDEAKLLALESLLVLGSATFSGACRDLSVELSADVADSATTNEALQNFGFSQLCC